MAEIGLLSGLAVKNSHENEINDIKYFDALNKQNEAILMAKQKLFSDDIEFQNASNPYDAIKIREEGNQAIQQLSALRKAHPHDYFTNPDVQLQAKQIKQGMKSSPAVLRSVAYKDALNKYNAVFEDALKDPGKYDPADIDALRIKISNYDKFGHEDGVGGVQRDGGARPLVFTPPQEIVDVPDVLLKMGNKIRNFDVKKGTAPGEYTTMPKPDEIKAIKDSFLKQNGKSVQYHAKELGLNTPEQIDKWLTDNITAGFDSKYAPGDPTFWYEYGLKKAALAPKEAPKGSGYTPFDDLFNPNKPSGNIPTDLAYKVWNENPKIKVVGNSGQAVDLTGQKINYDGRYMTDAKGRRYLSGYVNVPLDVAKQTGIWSGDDEDGGISAAFLGKAVRRKKETKDGDGPTYVKVDYMMPIDSNDGTARQLYNSHAQPARLTGELSEGSVNPTQSLRVGQQLDGYEYVGGDPASQSSWKKL